MSSCSSGLWFPAVCSLTIDHLDTTQPTPNLADSDWLVVSTHLKNISQNGNLPQIGVKIKNIWNHHLAEDFGALFGSPVVQNWLPPTSQPQPGPTKALSNPSEKYGFLGLINNQIFPDIFRN